MSGSLQSDPTFFWMRHCATMAPALPSVTRTWQMVGLGHNPSWLSYHVWLGDFSRQTRGCCDIVYCFSYSTTRLFPRKDPPKNSPAGFHPRWDLLILWMKFCAQKTYRFKWVQHLAPTMLPQSICRSAVVEGWTCGKKAGCVAHCLFWASGFPTGNFPKANPWTIFFPQAPAFGDGLPSFQETFRIHTEMWVIPIYVFFVGVKSQESWWSSSSSFDLLCSDWNPCPYPLAQLLIFTRPDLWFCWAMLEEQCQRKILEGTARFLVAQAHFSLCDLQASVFNIRCFPAFYSCTRNSWSHAWCPRFGPPKKAHQPGAMERLRKACMKCLWPGKW